MLGLLPMMIYLLLMMEVMTLEILMMLGVNHRDGVEIVNGTGSGVVYTYSAKIIDGDGVGVVDE